MSSKNSVRIGLTPLELGCRYVRCWTCAAGTSLVSPSPQLFGVSPLGSLFWDLLKSCLRDILPNLPISPGNMEKETWLDCLAEGIDDLPSTERLIISLFYYENLTIQEIALVLELSESEVSKIHHDTVLELLKR